MLAARSSGVFPVGPSLRSESARERVADLEWSFGVAPSRPLLAEIRTGPGSDVTKRVLFSGKAWMTDSTVAAWREYRPGPGDAPSVTELAVKSPTPMALSSFTDITKKSGSAEIDRVAEQAMNALRQVSINVTRVVKINDDANGTVSGKIVAVSPGYAAQTYGNNTIVIHDRSKLSNAVGAGGYATMEYENGKAQVYNGCLFDVDIKAEGMGPDERNFLRSRMVEALSSFQSKPSNDQAVVEAMQWAMKETVERFNINPKAVSVSGLTVEDRFVKPQGPDTPALSAAAKPVRPRFA
jgi:hypothetical protein